ncbi:MAG: DHA2 family efflux MFS transporter permease subunit [Candidatus Binataceae bacterium]|nr:DHA2 family efflux MFS transporter permease subunit [Candidatus Binataceae bacterium]
MAASSLSSPAPVEAAHKHKWLIAIAVMLGATLEILDTSIINVALPHMQGSFSASIDQITWVLTSYLVSNGITIPMTGWISARFGRKRYFLFSVTAFVIASAMCGLAQSLTQIVIFRLLQGVAGAAMIPSSQAILMETFPPNEQALAMATWGLGLITAPILGPTLGGWITDNLNWRWNFYINLPLGALAIIMVFLFVHDPPYLKQRKGGRIDWTGIVLLALALGLLQLVLDRGQRSDWFAAPWVRYCTFFSVLSFIGLVMHELRFPDPVLDLRIFKHREFTMSVTIVAVMVSTFYGVNLLNPLFLQELLGYTAWKAGLAMLPRGIGAGVCMFTLGQLSRYGVDTRPLMGVGFVLASYATWQMAGWDLQVNMASILWPVLLFGCGSFGWPTLSAAAVSCVPRERMGYAASLYNMMRNTGAAIGISLVSNVLTERQQVHQTYLVQHFSVFEAWKMNRQVPLVPGGIHMNLIPSLTAGHQQGLGMVYSTIQAQAMLLAYNDIYRLLAFAMAALVPWFIFFKRPQSGQGGGAH